MTGIQAFNLIFMLSLVFFCLFAFVKLQENYIHISNKCMYYGVFKSFGNFGLKMCFKTCDTIPVCQSVSFFHAKKKCTISSENDQSKLYENNNCSYYQKIVETLLCGSVNCSAKSTCVKFRNGQSKCIIDRCDLSLRYGDVQYAEQNQRCSRDTKVPCAVAGQLRFTCMANGNWSSGNDICSDCDSPLYVNGIEYAPKDMVMGTNVTVPCALIESTAYRNYTCSVNGTWIKTYDTCTYCAEPVIIGNIKYASANQPEGRTVLIPCLNGASGSRYLICDNMGTWNETQNTCEDCDSPLIIDGVSYTDTYQPLDTSVSIPCNTSDDGYTFIGNKTRTYVCSSDGTWWLITNGCLGFAFKIFQSYTTSTFQQARQDCQVEGADLAIPDTQEKFDALSDAVSVHVSNTNSEYYFIGMTDLETEGVFKWIDGRNVTFDGWDAGQPSNWNGEQHCGIFQKPSMKWHDFNCEINCNFICEKTIMG